MTLEQLAEIDRPYALGSETTTFFRENGYVKLKNVFSKKILAEYEEEITRCVKELSQEKRPMEERDTYSKAFLQIFNLWRYSEKVKTFVFGKRLARMACELLGTKGVRVYHDQALYKEPSGGITPWHVDQHYWPLASDKVLTAWIPLQETNLEMGPLSFSPKSHLFKAGREFPISDESEIQIENNLRNALYTFDVESFEMGEVSFHYGWTFHRAEPNKTSRTRKVMTIIYMDSEMRILDRFKNKAQERDLPQWLPGAAPGDLAATELNPILYQR